MKFAFKLIFAIAFGLLISYVALIDNVLKKLVEQQGSQLLKAKLEVAELNFQLFPTLLTVTGLTATNPHEPLRNIISADEISAEIKIKSLFKQQLLIDTATIKNLRFQQRREISGAIEGLTPNPLTSNNLSSNALNSAEKSLDQAAIIETIKTPLLAEITNLNQQAAALNQQWQQRREALINSRQLNTYSKRWAGLKNAPPQKKLNGYRQLDSAIKADLATIAANQNALTLDLAVIKELQNQARSLIDQNITTGLANIAKTDTPTLTEALFVGRIKAAILNLVKSQGFKSLTASADTHSPQTTVWPVYIRTLKLNGFIELGNEPLAFDGNVERIYYGFQKIKHPTQFIFINSPSQQGIQAAQGELKFSGTIDQRNAQNPHHYAHLQLTNAPVVTLALSDSNDYRIMLGRATMSLNGDIDMKNSELNINIGSQFRDAQLTVETNLSGSSNARETNNALTTSLADLLRGIDRLDVNLSATGSSTNPRFSFSSSLDQLLQNASNQFSSTEYTALRPQLTMTLNESLKPTLDQFTNIQYELDAVANDLTAQQQALNNLRASLF